MSKLNAAASWGSLVTALLAADAAAAQRPETEIGEVVVTARRVSENIQEVPVSVVAFDAATLQRRTVTDMTDLTRIAPSMRFQGQGNIASTDISLRGVNRVPTGSGGATTVIYFLDVPIQNGTYMPTFDLGSLQVLRGPQGTLFGTSTIGGAILINPQTPGHNLAGYAKVTAGQHEYYQLEAAGDLPIVKDVLAVRLAAQIRRRDGYVENIGIGPDFNDIHTNSYRASVLFEPSASLRNTLVLDYMDGSETGWATIAYERLPPNPLLPPPVAGVLAASVDQALALGRFKTNSNVPSPFYKRKAWGLFNTTEWEVTNNLTIKNIVSYRNAKDAFVINNDGIGAAAFEVGRLTHEEDFTEELQVRGDLFESRLRWTVGGFYQKTTPLESGSLSTTGVQVNNQTNEDTSYAFFGNIGFDLSQAVTLNAGYRHSWTKQSICVSPAAAGLDRKSCERFAASSTPFDGLGFVNSRSDAPTWTVGVDWRVADNIFAYAVHRRGFRFGGASSGLFEHPCVTGGAAPPCAVPIGATGRAIDLRDFQTLDNETLKDFEVGVRTDWSVGGRNQRVNLTAFRYVYDNLIGALPLIGLVDPTVPGAPFASSVAFNSGQITTKGVEFDVALNPFEGLTLGLNGAFTDMEQTKPGVGPANFPIPITPATLAAPRWAGSVALRYILPFRPFNGEVSVNFDYFRTGSWQVQGATLPGYDLANMRVDIADIGGSGVAAGFWIRNLFDETYLQSPTFVGTTGLPARTGNFGDPRLWGVDLSYSW